MKKIISLFQRNHDGDHLVRNEIVPGAEWVAEGYGTATQKFDGTCCMIRGGRLYKRHEVKPGGKPPDGFEPATESDEITGKQQGWLLVGNGAEDQWHRQAWSKGHAIVHPSGPKLMDLDIEFDDGTYELCGPKIQGNPESLDDHWLIRHGQWRVFDDRGDTTKYAPRDFEGLRDFLATANIEGIVWHDDDGRMVKIKTRDFGLKRRAPISGKAAK